MYNSKMRFYQLCKRYKLFKNGHVKAKKDINMTHKKETIPLNGNLYQKSVVIFSNLCNLSEVICIVA